MEKNLNLIKNDQKYVLKNEEIEIVLNNLKIDSKELYEKIYKFAENGEKVFKVNVETSLANKEDKIVLKQIQTLFKKIEDSIISQLNSIDNINNSNNDL